MFPRRIVVFYTFVIQFLAKCTSDDPATGATDPHGCSADKPGEQYMSGYKFLQTQRALDLRMTSVDLLEGYFVKLGTNISCLHMRVDNIENDTAIVTIYYKWNTDINGAWHTFGQTFQFEKDHRGYDIMRSTEESGAPSGIYNFSYTTRDCTVVTVTSFGQRMNGTQSEEEKQEAGGVAGSRNAEGSQNTGENQDNQPQCMLWATGDNNRGVELCCEPYFTPNCKKNKDYSYSPSRCPPPSVEERVEL